MCRCVIILFAHLFGVPFTWRLRKKWRQFAYLSQNQHHSHNTWGVKDMESNYDEDINKNEFFQQLQREYPSVFENAINEGWILCVPRSGSFSKSGLLQEDFLGHILVPSEELPTSHFRTLAGTEVRLCNRVLTVAYDIARPCTAHILFEETFYTEDLQKYRIWCVERLLEQGSVMTYDSTPTVSNLRECVDLLWTEILNKHILEDLDTSIKEFEQTYQCLEDKPLQEQQDLVGVIYAKCLGTVLQDSKLRERTEDSRHLLYSIRIAVESYVLHHLRNLLPKAISANTAYEDASLNKIIKNLHELQLRDLGVRSDLYDSAIRGKLELARLDGFSTVLGKIGCLKRAVRFASQGDSSVSSDDLLPVLIFLVIRSGVPNWIAQLVFMKKFRFSTGSDNGADEAGFLITSLEAAVEHVKSGVLTEPIHSDADTINDNSSNQNESTENKDGRITISYFFKQIRIGNVAEVERILCRKGTPKVMPDVKLCHPLCSCEKCEIILAKNGHASLPTIHSRDDRGLTGLHIACLHGQTDTADFLINHGSDIDEVDANGTTALHCASARGHQSTLLLLLHANADPTLVDMQGNTILHVTAENGHDRCVKALLYFAEHTRWLVDLNASNCNGDTALHHASKWGYTIIVEILLEHGAQPQIRNRRGQTPLSLAHSTRILRMLEAAAQRHLYPIPRQVPFPRISVSPESIRSHDDERHSEQNYSTERIRRVERLLSAIKEGDLRLASYYLGLEGPEKLSNEQPMELCHPLCTCERCCLIEEIPVEHQRKPALGINNRDSDGQTALHVASINGHSSFVQSLLDAGANINLKTKSKGRTAIHLACINDQISVARILLNSGNCDVDVRDYVGDTALHFAVRTKDAKLVELLVRHGANPKIRNSSGVSPLDESEEKIMVGMVRILTGRANISH